MNTILIETDNIQMLLQQTINELNNILDKRDAEDLRKELEETILNLSVLQCLLQEPTDEDDDPFDLDLDDLWI